MKVKNAKPLTLFFAKTRARLRVFFGFCPMCNSDAPKVYSCSLCNGQHRTNGPPSEETKAKWLTDYFAVLRSMARTRKLVAESQLNIRSDSVSKASEKICLIELRQTISTALTLCSEQLPDDWKVAFVAYPSDDHEGDGSSTIFLSDGSIQGAHQALESLAADPESETI